MKIVSDTEHDKQHMLALVELIMSLFNTEMTLLLFYNI